MFFSYAKYHDYWYKIMSAKFRGTHTRKGLVCSFILNSLSQSTQDLCESYDSNIMTPRDMADERPIKQLSIYSKLNIEFEFIAKQPRHDKMYICRLPRSTWVIYLALVRVTT